MSARAEAAVREFRSSRVAEFKESVIREMTRLALQHNAVNLAQGFPDFAAPEEIKRAAREAIADDINQYAITWGSKAFRNAIAAYYERFYQLSVDPEREITVCCGATEGMVAAMLALLNAGDEVIVFEPFYENYWPDSQLSGAVCRFVRLHEPDWSFDPAELRRAFTAKTRAVILNTPNNPTGRVLRRDELEIVSALCQEFDCLLITDEIYEHILFGKARHIPPITLPGMRDRCVLVNSLSKTFSVTGWRVGWVIAAPALTASIRKVHDFLTVGAPSPLQQAGVVALAQDDTYYRELAAHYTERRDLCVSMLEAVGFRTFQPQGAYYVMCDISAFQFPSDVALAQHLVEHVGVGAVPGSSFYHHPGDGAHLLRFCFAKRRETIALAGERLRAFHATAG